MAISTVLCPSVWKNNVHCTHSLGGHQMLIIPELANTYYIFTNKNHCWNICLPGGFEDSNNYKKNKGGGLLFKYII